MNRHSAGPVVPFSVMVRREDCGVDGLEVVGPGAAEGELGVGDADDARRGWRGRNFAERHVSCALDFVPAAMAVLWGEGFNRFEAGAPCGLRVDVFDDGPDAILWSGDDDAGRCDVLVRKAAAHDDGRHDDGGKDEKKDTKGAEDSHGRSPT